MLVPRSLDSYERLRWTWRWQWRRGVSDGAPTKRHQKTFLLNPVTSIFSLFANLLIFPLRPPKQVSDKIQDEGTASQNELYVFSLYSAFPACSQYVFSSCAQGGIRITTRLRKDKRWPAFGKSYLNLQTEWYTNSPPSESPFSERPLISDPSDEVCILPLIPQFLAQYALYTH